MNARRGNLNQILKTNPYNLTNSKTIAIKKLLTIFSLFLLVLFTSCKQGNTVSQLGKNIRSILQDRNGNYWFGSDGEGVYRYDGKTLIQFTFKDGLPNNQVRTIQEDKSGNIWFVTGEGICHYDGKSFTTFTDTKEKRDSLTSFNGGTTFPKTFVLKPVKELIVTTAIRLVIYTCLKLRLTLHIPTLT